MTTNHRSPPVTVDVCPEGCTHMYGCHGSHPSSHTSPPFFALTFVGAITLHAARLSTGHMARPQCNGEELGRHMAKPLRREIRGDIWQTDVPKRSRHKSWRCIVVCANAVWAAHNNHGEFGDKKHTGTHGTSALARSPSLRRSSRPTESTGLEGWTHALSRSAEDSTRKSNQTYRDREATMPVPESRISG